MEQKMHNFFAICLSFLTVSSVVKIHVILFERIYFMTFCHTTAGNGANFWTHEQTDEWTDRHGSRNSYLDKAQSIQNLVTDIK